MYCLPHNVFPDALPPCCQWRWCVFQAEDGIRYLVRSRGLGDVYKRQAPLPGLRFQAPEFAAAFLLAQALLDHLEQMGFALSLIHI